MVGKWEDIICFEVIFWIIFGIGFSVKRDFSFGVEK